MSSNSEHKDQIEALIAKELSGNSAPDESKQLSDWLAASEANQKLYAELASAWTLDQKQNRFSTQKAWKKVESRIANQEKVVPIQRPKSRLQFLAYAASLALIIGSALFYINNKDEVYSSSDGQLAVVLEDNSSIDLNSASELQVLSDFNDKERRVKLSGEAFFDIAKNKEKPFVIETDLVEVKVLGTSFNVNENKDSVVVTVASGIVQVSDVNEPNKKRKLVKGEKLVFRNNSKSFEQLDFDQNDLAWKTRTLVFRRTDLNNAFSVLEATYNIKIQVDNPAINNCKLTAQFEDQSLEEVLNIIATTFGLDYTINDNIVKINGEGC